MHPADQPQRARASDRSRRTVSVVTSYSAASCVHRQPAALGDQVGDRLLAFLGVHRSRVAPSERSVYVLFYARIVLTVKGGPGVACRHERPVRPPLPCTAPRSSPASPTGPPLVVRGEVSPDAIARFDGAGARRGGRARGVRRRGRRPWPRASPRRADKAAGAAAEVLTASAGLARDKGLRSAVRKHLRSRRRPAGRRCSAAVEQFVGVFTQMGGLMAERVTDLRDIERRVVAHLVGEPEPGVQMPDDAVGAGRRGPRARPTPPASTRRVVARAGDRARRPDQPHRDHRPPARRSPAWSARPGAMALAAGTLAPGRRRRPATVEPRPDADEAARLVEADRAAREALATWTGPGATADGTRVKLLANVADGESARAAAVGPGRGRRAVPHRAVLPQPRRRAVRRGAGRRSTPRCSRRSPGRYVVVRTLDAGSDKPVAFATHEGEENPALGVRGLRLSFDNPGLLDAPARRHRRRGRARPAPRPG